MLAFNASEDTVARNSGSWTLLDPYVYVYQRTNSIVIRPTSETYRGGCFRNRALGGLRGGISGAGGVFDVISGRIKQPCH
jgi:hypothetical protein